MTIERGPLRSHRIIALSAGCKVKLVVDIFKNVR
jgi:hypothetical protein